MSTINQKYLVAAYNGQLEEMNRYLEAGADPYAKDEEGRVIPRGDFQDCDSSGWNALHFACERSQEPVCGQLLTRYPALANQENSETNTPFFRYLACGGRSKEIFEMFISAGALLNQATREGWTPLHLLARRTNYFPELKSILTDLTAAVKRVVIARFPEGLGAIVVSYIGSDCPPAFLNLQTKGSCETPLHKAINKENHKAVGLLRGMTDLSLKNAVGVPLKETLKAYDRQFGNAPSECCIIS